MKKVFLLSPARTGGERARLIFSPNARFDLARRLQAGKTAPIGEIFSFLSGLYFRGKLTYASAFADPPRGAPPVLVITSSSGLVPANQAFSLSDLAALADTEVDHREPRYSKPLKRDALVLAKKLPTKCAVVLLGSVSTRKYTDPLLEVFGERLVFPIDFIGRGDMSRGGLLLRCAAHNIELEYRSVSGAVLRGKRPARLPPIDPTLRQLYNSLRAPIDG